MNCCCSTIDTAADRQFSEKRATNDLAQYRTKGPGLRHFSCWRASRKLGNAGTDFEREIKALLHLTPITASIRAPSTHGR
jgi:hypothetical protein